VGEERRRGIFDTDEVTKPIYIYLRVLIAIPFILYSIVSYASLQNSLNLFDAADNFQYVNRLVLHHNYETFEMNHSDYNFDELKALLNPLGERSYAFLDIDMHGLALYTHIDYFIGNRLLLTANIYKITNEFVLDELNPNFFVINNSSISIGGYTGLVFLNNYNQNIVSRLLTRAIPLSRFDNNEPNIHKALSLLSYE